MTAAETEQFSLAEDAVKAGRAPAKIAAAFTELSALREQLNRFGDASVRTSKP